MNRLKSYFPHLIASCFLLPFLLTGCVQDKSLSEVQADSPQVQADGPCPEVAEGTTTYTILSPGDFPDLYIGWDVIIEVSYETPPATPENCECVSDEFCAYFSFPQYAEAGFRIGLSDSKAATSFTELLTPNGTNGYIGHTPQPLTTSPHTDTGIIIGGVPAPGAHQVCDADGDFIIKIAYPDDMPPAEFPSSPLITTSGICVVDIVGN